MENPNREHSVAYRVIEDALGDTNQDKSLIAERVLNHLYERGLIHEKHLLVVQVAIANTVTVHRQAVARSMVEVSLAQRIHSDLAAKQLLK